MSDGEDDVVSKGEFARLCNVSPGRVTQWIAERKISGQALVGDGRSARIRVSAAQAQLKRHLDPNQMTANGVRTRIPSGPLVESSAPPPIPEPDPVVVGDLTTERAALTREQRLNWEIRNAERLGELIDAAEAERRWTVVLVALRSRMLAIAGDLATILPHLTVQDIAAIDRAIRDAMDHAADGDA